MCVSTLLQGLRALFPLGHHLTSSKSESKSPRHAAAGTALCNLQAQTLFFPHWFHHTMTMTHSLLCVSLTPPRPHPLVSSQAGTIQGDKSWEFDDMDDGSLSTSSSTLAALAFHFPHFAFIVQLCMPQCQRHPLTHTDTPIPTTPPVDTTFRHPSRRCVHSYRRHCAHRNRGGGSAQKIPHFSRGEAPIHCLHQTRNPEIPFRAQTGERVQA